MKIAVIGATGNAGTGLLESLAGEEIVAVARRKPARAFPRTRFVAADIVISELVNILRGADAVVHLAWLIQPGRDGAVTYSVNVTGSERVFRAAVEAKVKTLATAIFVHRRGS